MKFPLEVVDEMFLEGLEMKRQQFRRAHPDAASDEIEDMVRAWIAERPMDAPGQVRHL